MKISRSVGQALIAHRADPEAGSGYWNRMYQKYYGDTKAGFDQAEQALGAGNFKGALQALWQSNPGMIASLLGAVLTGGVGSLFGKRGAILGAGAGALGGAAIGDAFKKDGIVRSGVDKAGAWWTGDAEPAISSSMQRIFGSMLSQYFASPEWRRTMRPLVSSMVDQSMQRAGSNISNWAGDKKHRITQFRNDVIEQVANNFVGPTGSPDNKGNHTQPESILDKDLEYP